MAATLNLTHRAIGVEVRRGTYTVVLDGERVGSLEMNETYERPVEAGRHTLQVRNGRNSSRTKTFETADGEIVAFRSRIRAPPGRHTLNIRDGRYSSRELSFQVTDGQVISFRCHGRRATPIFLTSLVLPRWALKLRRE
jgi:hypothetical protein